MLSLLLLNYRLSEHLQNKVNTLRNKQVLLASSVLLLGAIFSQPSWAQSIKSAADGTNTIIKQNGNQFDISGGKLSGDRANLFQSLSQFSLNQNQIANFLSQPNIKNILGRVVGGDASLINGLIKVTGSNANLFLINPAGIVFGTYAQLNVPASFTATTATGIGFGNNLWFSATGLNNYTSLVGNPESFAFNVNQPGSIINAGLLQVGTGQNIFLLGGNVINTGTLTAPEGNLTLAAVPGTSLVKVSQTGHLLNLEIAPQQGNTVAGITPLTLPELLTGHGLNPATGITVDSTGQISLTSSGVAITSGNLNVAGQTGGAVNVLGNNVNLINANINAAGIFGGGQVLIGGDEHGRLGTVPNAQSTFVDQNTRINADALTSGNGGKVIVWSDNNTVFSGNISAQGGNQSGNGGFVEVSGKQRLQYDGLTDLRAANGAIGNLLLDPATFVIANSGGDITPTTVANQWNLANTTYSATTSLTVTDSITGNSSYNLTLDAPTINLNAPITNSSRGLLSGTTNNTTVNVGSSGSIQNGINVAANGGNINLAATTYTVTGQIELGKSLTVTGMGANNTNVSGGGTTSVFNIDGSGTNVTLNALNIINGNTSSGNGGGIQVGSSSNLNLLNIAISGNSAQNGGGIYNNGTTTISNSTISDNSASANNILSNGFGGGIYNNGTITISNSTISDNSASANNILSNGFGGGIYNNRTITISNSTISGNSASANILSNGLGGGIYNNNGTITITNSIIAGNTASTTSSNEAYFSSSSITSLGYNLVGQNGNAGGFPEIGTDIILSGAIGTAITALGYYGGTTQTYALVAGSPAIDAGNITASTLAIDQRGAQRGGFGGVNAGSTIDIGAFEASSSYLVTNTSDSNSPSLGSLRAAVNFTNSGLNVNNNPANITTPATNTINFDTSGTFATPQTIVLSNPKINITKPVNLIFGDNGITITGDLTTAANGTIGLSGILTANNLSFNDPVKLLNNTMIKGNTIAFNSTVDGNSNLIANLSGGNLTFAGAVGGTTALGNINTDSSGITSFNTVTAKSLTTSVDGTTQLNANITTTNVQTYNNPVTLANSPTLTGNGITFNNTVDGNSNLTANTTSGNITFAGAVGGRIALGDINTNSSGITSFNTVTANSLTTSESGTTQLNANITTTNAQTYNNPVTLANSPTLTGNGITFNNKVDGNSNLTANTTSGNITFAGTVGGTIALGDINTNSSGITSFNTVTANSLTTSESGTTQLNANINTQGGSGQSFGNPVQLVSNVSLNSNNKNIIFSNTINGTHDLTVNAGTNNTTFVDAIGNNNPLDNLTVTSNLINIDLTKVTTTGAQTYNGTLPQGLQGSLTIANSLNFSNPINLTGNTVLNFIQNIASVKFAQGLNGTYDLTLNKNIGNLDLIANLGNTIPLANFTINSPSSSLQANITTIGNQTYNSVTTLANSNLIAINGNINFTDAVNLTNTSTLKTGSSINFFKTVDGSQNLNLTADGDINFDGAVGSSAPLAELTINNAANVIGGNINAGSIDQATGTGSTQLGNITTTSGGVNLTNRNDIITGDITTNGQDINLNGKDVFTGNLNSSAAIAGGNISLFASNQIIVKSLDSSANLGNGGNVTIDPLSVSLDSINAQGGTTGSGGIVDITSFGSFRATGTFTDRNGTLASISTAGGAGSGDITIRYGAAVPFTVGDATVQGTAGAITSAANNTIAPTRSFFTAYTQGNISLIPYQPIPNLKEQDIPLEIALSSNEQVALDVDAIIREKISTLLSQENLEAAVPLVEDLWDSEYQGYYGKDLQPTADIQTTETIQGALKKIAQQTGKKSAIVYIICQYNSVELLVITPEGKILHKSVKVSNREALLELTKQFRNQLVVESDKTGYKSSGRKLYNLLIKPIEPVLTAEKIDTLLFSVDSGLRSLPLAALYDGHQFLVEKYSLSIIPSVSLMDTRYQSLHNAKVLAMGASKFLSQNPLPSVTVELPIIVQNFGQKQFFINEEFTVKNLLAQHQQHPTQIIHLATHGLFNPGTPKNSYIQFWNQEKLQLDQLRNLNLKNPPVELFVLSACRTALGNEEVELGFAGLAVQAGAKSALASLWSVSDEGSLVLMNQFYQNLKTTPIKAEALRQAQVAMIQGRVNIKNGQLRGIRGDISLPAELGISGNLDLSHPYYWAAFTMIGSPW